MGEIFHCGDTGALVGFLYEECEVNERATIAAHLAICSTCAADVAALSGTRQQLSAWAPPDAQLDFRLTGAPTPAAPTSWWWNPLPAWAQLAAAVLIFAAGTGMGVAFSRSAPWQAAVTSAVDVAGVDRAELTRLDQRVRAVEHKSIQTVPVALDDSSRQAMATWVRQEIRESERRNRVLLAETIFKINEDRALDVTTVASSARGPMDISFGPRREE